MTQEIVTDHSQIRTAMEAEDSLGGGFEVWTKDTVNRELRNEDEVKIQRELEDENGYQGQQEANDDQYLQSKNYQYDGADNLNNYLVNNNSLVP